MPTPEQFTFYHTIINGVLLPQHDVMDLYLDFGCQYKRSWHSVTDEQAQAERTPRFIVPWMHARSHGTTCYLANSGLFQAGAGRRVGEQMEHVWSATKPLARMTRYMSAPARHDFLDDAFGFISSQKAANFPEQLQASYRATLRKQGELTSSQFIMHVTVS
jgi:hypothetical protein